MVFCVKKMMTVMAGGRLTTAAVSTGCGLQNITQATDQATLDYKVQEKVAGLVVVAARATP